MPKNPSSVETYRQSIASRRWTLSIGGEQRPGSGPMTAIGNPSTGGELVTIASANVGDVAESVERARAAVPGWAATPARERARVVRRLADALEDHAEELAWLDTLDAGLPLWMMRIDAATGIERMRLFADSAMELKGQTIPASAHHVHMTFPEPFGVVARIIPFNHPFMFATSKLAAPLVAGNTVVLKPSEMTPLSALRLAEIARDILPAGVLSVVHGGPEVGDALVRHPSVHRIAFTGSVSVARSIQRAGAEVGIKHVSLELGGKNAMLVFPDVDLDRAVAGAVKGMNFAFAGQSCGSTSRVLVHRSMLDEFTERYLSAVEAIRLGLPWADGTQIGPMISQRQRDRALGLVRGAIDQGARVLTGGAIPDGLPEAGHYMQPTVLGGVDPSMTVANEEIFGPVVSLMPFDDEDDALVTANQVQYGLTASVWTNDLNRAHRLARRLDAGYVWINDTSTHFPGVPFGGVKESGVGREESLEELMSYTQVKAVNVVLS